MQVGRYYLLGAVDTFIKAQDEKLMETERVVLRVTLDI